MLAVFSDVFAIQISLASDANDSDKKIIASVMIMVTVNNADASNVNSNSVNNIVHAKPTTSHVNL